jgi:nucleoid DNA-binding protein
MNDKKQIAKMMAERCQAPEPAAADELDRIVHDIVRRLRQGKEVALPGIGRLVPELKRGQAARARR